MADVDKAVAVGASHFAGRVAGLKDTFSRARPLRAGSLIVTLFGDVIVPRGGSVWLGSLVRLLEPFGINDRLVRTSVFRLTREGWLAGSQSGRRSYYSLTPDGRRRFDRAARHIYAPPPAAWSGEWTLAFIVAEDGARREVLRKELGWLGFGRLDTGVLGHPSADSGSLAEALADLEATDEVVIMASRAVADANPAAQRALAASSWDLDDLTARYTAFCERYTPVHEALTGDDAPDPEDCLTVRLLMIHEYRKTLLRDPRLPRALLPSRWVGETAYALCRRLYSAVLPGAERWVSLSVETADGGLPPADLSLGLRFRDAPLNRCDT